MIKILLLACPLIGIQQGSNIGIFNAKTVHSVHGGTGSCGGDSGHTSCDYYFTVDDISFEFYDHKELEKTMNKFSKRLVECLK